MNVPFHDDIIPREVPSAPLSRRMSTSQYDAYRQGVELTLPKHHAMGFIKIHAGYFGQNGNHQVPQLGYGQTQHVVSENSYYLDIVTINPNEYLERGVVAYSEILDRGTDLDVSVDNFDGVIEPFLIRDVISFKKSFIDVEHKLWGALDEGNIVNRQGSDVFVNIEKISDISVGTRPMVDVVDHMGDIITVSNSNSPDSRKLSPFVDNSFVSKGVMVSSNMDTDLIVALRTMSPGTVNLQPSDYHQLGATGFVY